MRQETRNQKPIKISFGVSPYKITFRKLMIKYAIGFHSPTNEPIIGFFFPMRFSIL